MNTLKSNKSLSGRFSPALAASRTQIQQFVTANLGIMIVAYLVTFIVYMYLFTTPIFVDHTFSNTWFVPFPSHRTTTVGRWFVDILDYALGNTGDPSFQMSIGSGIQVVNGLLFSIILGLKKRVQVLLCTLILCLHPAFLDYYSFARDHIGLTFGDTLCLLGVLSIYNIRDRWLAISLAALAFLLALSIYQPKIALIALLLLLLLIRVTVAPVTADGATREPLRLLRHNLSRYAFPALLALLAAAALAYVSSEFVMSRPESAHTEINGVYSIFFDVLASYLKIASDYSVLVDYLPGLIHWAPLVVILSGLGLLAGRAFRESWILGLATLLLAALIPPALQSSFIINDETPAAARILAPQAYCLLFFLAAFWTTPRLGWIGTGLASAFAYFFAIIGVQETNEAATKHIFDMNKISRIVSRIEAVVPSERQGSVPLVTIGYLRPRDLPTQRMFQNSLYLPRTRYESMNEFCDVGEINFFLGKGGLTVERPSAAAVDSVLRGLAGHHPWPAPDSVYMQDGTIVLLLQPYVPGLPVTWSKEQFYGGWPELREFCG